jgi:drug/metabolite transporter (DMT)-like permease
MSLFPVLAGRFMISSLILVVLALVRGFERLSRRQIGIFVIAAVVYPGLYFYLETAGIARSSAVLAAIVISGIPVLSAIISRIFLGETLPLRGWIGVFLSIAGIVMIVLLADQGVSADQGISAASATSSLVGVLLVCGAAVMGAAYIASTRHLMASHRPITLTTIQNVMGLLFFAPLAGVQIARQGLVLNLWGGLSVVFLGVFASVGAILCFNKALSLMTANQASPYLNIIPVISLLFGWIILGEGLNLWQAGAGIVVIGGVLLATYRVRVGSP